MAHPAFLIVDNHALQRLVLRRIISHSYPYALVYFADSSGEAQQKLLAVGPSIGVTGFYLPDRTGDDVLGAV